jgi:DNA mismatch repair protein MutS
LVLLDEIGRGTSTFDGLSIAWAVAEHLHDVTKAKTLFATHYHELTEITKDKPHAINRHVAVREHQEHIVFLRKLADGATNRSYGVQVARLAGLPRPVIDRARQVLEGLEAQSLEGGRRAKPSVPASQLSLFQKAALLGPSPAEAEVLEKLRAAAPDDLSPREAHALLTDLQRRLLPDDQLE